ncbi:MAG: hypothetical protein AB7N76_09925 [Planctomycetota bacterium]
MVDLTSAPRALAARPRSFLVPLALGRAFARAGGIRLPVPRPAARRALLGALAALALCLGWALLPRLVAPVDEEAEQLRRALAEARINCLVADLAAEGRAQDPLFQTTELLAALSSDRVQRGAYGELPALEREARWIGELTTSSDLGGRSWEDVRFLVGALHWYLAGAGEDVAPGEAHAVPHERYQQERLREFKDLGYEDLLARWD